MLVYRMAPVPLRLFHKNLGNLQVLFWASGKLLSLPPPPGKKWPLLAPMIALVSLTSY